jgi:hypothetical protein
MLLKGVRLKPLTIKANVFSVGDIIKQRYQHGASERLVLGSSPTTCTIVWDRDRRQIMWVHGWAHDKVSHVEINDAERMGRLGHPSHLKWILGSQYE